MPIFDLSEQVAVITGGGSGIGQSIAKVFAQQGAEVHILEINEVSGQETQAKIRQAGGNAFVHACDIADRKSVV